jgi:CheY-specific phosphatase CheX
MEVSELDQMLSDSAVEVLESMFFTSLAEEGVPCGDLHGPCISARLSFRGNPPGRFGVRTPPKTALTIAANFLGLEEDALTESQIGEVICELANMLCGSVLSRLEKESRFELSGPELDPPETGCPECFTAWRVLELEEGPLGMWLELEQPR